MRTKVHVCSDAEDAALAAPLIRLLSDPVTGLLAEPPIAKGPFHAMNAEAVRDLLAERIRETDVIACLVGPVAHTSHWIDWEIETGLTLGKGLVGVRLRAGIHDFMPRGLVRAGAQIVDSHAGSVIAALERAAFGARSRPGNK